MLLDTITHSVLSALAIVGLVVLCALGKVDAAVAVPIIAALGGLGAVSGTIATVRRQPPVVIQAPLSGESPTMAAPQ